MDKPTTDTEKLIEFIRLAKERQVSDDFIVTLLRQRAWPESGIFRAFSAYYEGVLGAPVPSRGTRIEQARDAFLYLLAFITLGFWMVALILLADVLIDRAFPSALDVSFSVLFFRREAASSLATLIIAFPLYLFVSRLIAREVGRRIESLDSGVRKWLTYIALVLTAVTLLGDAVAFLSEFLRGDLTVRFALKALVLFVVAGGIFWYYLGTVRPEARGASRDRLFGLAATAAVCVAVALGFTAVGTPASERALSLDERRVEYLQRVAQAIKSEWAAAPRGTFKLPQDLDQIPSLSADVLKDPVTRQRFEYMPGVGASYRLCANFDTENRGQSPEPTWEHSAGHYCFMLDAARSVFIGPGYISR